MAHSYTPGLKVKDGILLRKERILPLKGTVKVQKGDKVTPDDVVAETHLPGAVEPINVANILGVPPEDVGECMLKNEGDQVTNGEVFAMTKSFFGLFKSEAKSKLDGSIENVSSVTGQVLLRGHPVPVQVRAYVEGEVVDVHENEGVTIEVWGAFVQGIFGIGGEVHGDLTVAVASNTEVLDENHIKEEHKGKIVVGGSLVTAEALKKAIAIGATGIVAGGFGDKDLRDFLGYDLGVAITGNEELGVTLVVTEGFGEIEMAGKTFELLKNHEGQHASINGATQIRAGVIRPEVIIPKAKTAEAVAGSGEIAGLDIGSPVRVIRAPYFGHLGTVTGLPPALQALESESKARVLEVEFPGGERSIIPRANVEMIEGI